MVYCILVYNTPRPTCFVYKTRVIDNFRVVIQAVYTTSGRVGTKIAVTFKESIEFFVVGGAEQKVGVNLKLARRVKQVKPVPLPSEASPPSGVSPGSQRLMGSNFTLTGVLQIVFMGVIGFAIIEVLYENQNNRPGTFCNLKVPENFHEDHEFTRNFNIKYLLPVSTFTPENYIHTIAKETKTTEIEVFHNFVLNQKLIVTASRNASYLIITVVIFRGILRICKLVVIELFGTAVVQNNSFMVAVVTYPLCFIITN